MTVLIATYARPRQLVKAIDSLFSQTRPPDEVLVVRWDGDDASGQAVTEAISCADGRLREITVATNTVSAKENHGLASATGDVICFLDDDAVPRPDWLARIQNHYLDQRVGAVGGRDLVHHLSGQPVRQRLTKNVGRVSWFGRLVGNHHQGGPGVRNVDFLKGCNMSFRRNLLSPVDERLIGSVPYGFEIDLGLAVRNRGHLIVYDPDIVVDHFASSNMRPNQAHLAVVSNHNQTYILLKRLPALQRWAFLAYTFLIGDRNTIGLARVPLQCWPARWPGEVIRAHFTGKLAGFVTYRAWRHSARDHEC